MEVTKEICRQRAKWSYRGESRPSFAEAPGAGRESVWDYPRPPRIVPDTRRIVVIHAESMLADTTRAMRILETAGPPTFYLPRSDVETERLAENDTTALCEWKGVSVGLDLIDGSRDVGWRYAETFPEFESILGWIAFYPARIQCFVDGERVRPQPGSYYGGWITDEIVGPFKGEAGIEVF